MRRSQTAETKPVARTMDTETAYPAPDNALSADGSMAGDVFLVERTQGGRWPLRRTFLAAIVVSTLAWAAIISTAIEFF